VIRDAFALVVIYALAAGAAAAGTRLGTNGSGDGYGNSGHACYTPRDKSGAGAPTPPAGPVLAGRKPGASSGIGV
jgi:hypothetical protein